MTTLDGIELGGANARCSRREKTPRKRRLSLIRGSSGVNHQLAAVAGAFARRPHACRAIELEVNDAALARRHGIELEWLAGLAHALRGDARRKLQLREARGAIIAAIEPHAIVEARIEPQPAMRDVLERQQQLGIFLEQQILIGAAES